MVDLVSPGVAIKEKDLTTSVRNEPTSIGAVAIIAEKGPMDQVVIIESEQQLVDIFGKPNTTNHQYWYSAASFLMYSNTLKVVRIVTTGAVNACVSGSALLIKNNSHYTDGDGSTGPYDDGFANVGEWAARSAGAWGNSLRVEACNTAAGFSESAKTTTNGEEAEGQTVITLTSGTGFSVYVPQSADARWMAERNRDFYQRLIIEANRIAVRNRRGAANFIVCTPRAAAILEMLPEFQWVPVQGNVNTQPVGVAKVGNLGGRFNVYRDTRTESQFEQNAGYISQPDQGTYTPTAARETRVEYALLGYKGPEFYDTGIIYCPYIPVMVQRTIGPNDFSPRVGLLTRYGVVDNIFGANLYYHVIILKNLGDAFTPGSQAVYF